jgi:hypothetical protein
MVAAALMTRAPLERDLEAMTDTIGTFLAAHAARKALTATIDQTY